MTLFFLVNTQPAPPSHACLSFRLISTWIVPVCAPICGDMTANMGVILAGSLVAPSGPPYADPVIGLIVAAIFVKGGASMIQEANASRR